MNITEVKDNKQLRDFMTAPSEGLIEFMKSFNGDILTLGASGKMGPELIEMIIRADRDAGAAKRKILVASTFSNPKTKSAEILKSLGVSIYKGDLTEESFLKSIPRGLPINSFSLYPSNLLVA